MFDLDVSGLPEGYLDEVLAFAEKRGLKDQLIEQFTHLAHRKPEDRQTKLFKDFAPYSFLFQEYIGEKPYIFGGLIFHGNGDSGVSAPTFSVRLGDLSERWSIHT